MRFVPSLVHGVADYLVSLLVIVVPLLLGASTSVAAAYACVGLAGLVYSALTDYELGLWRRIAMKTHLTLDGLFVIAMLGLPLVMTLPPGLGWFSVVVAAAAALLVATTKTHAG